MNEVEIIRAKRNGDEERLHELLKKDIEYNQSILEFLEFIKKEKSSDSFERVLFNQTIGNDKMKQK